MTALGREWLRHGFSTLERDAWQRNLVHDPAEARAWADGGVGPDLAEAFKKCVREALPEDIVPHIVRVPNRHDVRPEIDIDATLEAAEPAIAQRIARELAAVKALPDPQPCYIHPERSAEQNGVVDGHVRTLCVNCATSRGDVTFPWAQN